MTAATKPHCNSPLTFTGCVHWDDDQLLSLGEHIGQIRQEDSEFCFFYLKLTVHGSQTTLIIHLLPSS